MSRVEWRSQRAACFTTIHAVVDGDLMTVCGKPAFQAAPTRPARSQGQVCPDCVEIGRELARHIAELDTEGQEERGRLGYALLCHDGTLSLRVRTSPQEVEERFELAGYSSLPGRVVEVWEVADRG